MNININKGCVEHLYQLQHKDNKYIVQYWGTTT